MTKFNGINDQVQWNRTHFNEAGVKQLAIENIDFWEGVFKENKKNLKAVKKKLK